MWWVSGNVQARSPSLDGVEWGQVTQLGEQQIGKLDVGEHLKLAFIYSQELVLVIVLALAVPLTTVGYNSTAIPFQAFGEIW